MASSDGVRERGTVYLAVIGVVAVVTILALSGVALRAQFRDRAQSANDSASARRLVRSAAEAAIVNTDDAVAWRTNATSGYIFSGVPMEGGVLSTQLIDSETGLKPTISTTQYRVTAEAVVGEARSRLAFEVAAANTVSPYQSLLEGYSGISYWALDESNGKAGASEPISGLDGSYLLPDEAGVSTNKDGWPAPYFDRYDGGVRVEHDRGFELENGTLCFWVRFPTLPSPGWSHTLVSKEDSTWDYSAYFTIWATNRQLHVKLQTESSDWRYGGGGSTITATDSLTARTWHFIAVSWGDSGLNLYVDGDRVAADGSNTIDLARYMWRDPNTKPWYFGVWNAEAFGFQPSWPAQASMASIGLTDVALSQAQIRELQAASTVGASLEVVQGSFRRVVD